MWHSSIVLIKTLILDWKKEPLYVSKLIFWNFHRYLVLLWSLFCFWEVLKQSKISANGLRWKFVMSLNSFDQVNYLELIKKSLLKLQTYLFGILSLNMVQYWPLFCFWEASKWSYINADGLKWNSVMFHNNFNHKNHLT